MKNRKKINGLWTLIPAVFIAIFLPTFNNSVKAEDTETVESTTTTEPPTTTTTINPGPFSILNAGFEDNSFSGWDKGSQTGTLGASITSNGTGVSIFNGSRTFTYGSHGAVGNPTLGDGSPNPYYAPAVTAGSWTFSPNNDSYAALLQPKSEQTFSQAMTALGLSGAPQTAIQNLLIADSQSSGYGSPNPTDAAWISREVELTAGVTYTMSWNYVGTDYVPYNDGSLTSLIPVTVESEPTINVNNYTQTYALLGFTNPGTGDYSVNSFGATGWQTSTYEVSVTGIYKLGFAVFNLGDTALSPVLMIDNEQGVTESCTSSGTCTTFGGVQPNNDTAPAVETTTTTTTTTTTAPTTTTTVQPYYNAVNNLVATANENGSVTLDWDAPDSSNIEPYIYTITWFDLNEGVESGGWGVWTYASNTSYTVGSFQFPNTSGYGLVRFKVTAGNAPCVGEGNGSCIYGTHASVDATVTEPVATTTTSSTTTTTTTVPVTTTTSTVQTPAPQIATTTQPEVVYVPVPVETTTTIPEESTTTTEVTLPEETTTEETVPTTEETTPTTEPEIIPSEDSIPEEEEVVAEPENPEPEIVEETIEEVIQPEEAVSDILEEISSGEITEEVLDILESDSLTEEQVAEIIDAILEKELDEESAAILATSAAVLENITSDQAAQIFSSVDTESLTEEVKAEIIDAVQDAPVEVKEAFEEEINIYAEGFDEYVPLGSNVDVGTRRSLIAATAATAAIAAAGVTASNSPSGGSGSSNNTKTGNDTNARREEEEEASGEIAELDHEDDEKFTRNSIFTYYINGGIEMKKFNPFGFLNKVWDITAGLAFTLAGSVVVFITLSGDTRKMAMIATAAALVVHYVHEILDNDE